MPSPLTYMYCSPFSRLVYTFEQLAVGRFFRPLIKPYLSRTMRRYPPRVSSMFATSICISSYAVVVRLGSTYNSLYRG